MIKQTIVITDELITVQEGQLPKAKIAYKGAGIEIYKLGRSKYHHADCVPNLAMNICLNFHIPVISLRIAK